MGRDRPTLRKRGSSDRMNEPSRYRKERGSKNGDAREDFTTQRIPHNSTAKTTSTSRSTRIVTLVILCMLMFWVSFWGIVMGIGLGRSAINIVFGTEDPEISSENHPEEPQSILELEDSQSSIQGLRGFAVEFSDDQHNKSSEAESEGSEGLSTHDLNAKSHLLKAEGRQIINDGPMENSEYGKGDKSYMGQDSTADFYFAGEITEEKRIVNTKGRIEIISYPAHSYAVLPALLDSNPFAISIWVYLSPSTNNKENDGVKDDNRGPRVILSTRSTDDRGCQSGVFGDRPSAGFILYAQPHDDGIVEGDGDAKNYRILLEYAQTDNIVCRTLIGSNKKGLLVREGQWHHVTVFATQVSGEGDERMSLYVNGYLAGRKTQESRRLHGRPESKTTVGRYTHGTPYSGNKNSDLDGRIGMLSFWETGGDQLYSAISKRMKIQSESDEDHVVRAINRAAFDARAIKELSLQGLAVKEPTLLYAFDGCKENKATNELYTEQLRLVNEAMSGRNGTIMSSHIDGTPAHQRQAFIPLGGNRYTEYKDGTFVLPTLKSTRRQELNEIARARSGIVKKAMQHVWSGYKKYAYGRDELLPLSNGGQDNWGGMGTTLVDSLSTLWMLGMKEEFWEARDWIRDNLDFGKVKGGVSVFETTIRNLGGLLSAYDLSGDKIFLEKADDLGTRLVRAFESRTGIPYGTTELFDGGRSYNTGWHPNEAVLSEIGTLQVEFRYLARVSGKSEYATHAMRALDEILKLDAKSGLYPTFIYNTKQELSFGNNEISIGAMGDSFYEYLLKVWLQGGKKEMKYRRMYDKSVTGILDKLIHMSRPNYLTYVAERKGDRVIHKMDHLSCFLGGNLALGAYVRILLVEVFLCSTKDVKPHHHIS